MTLTDRFLRYVSIWTTSDGSSVTVPSTARQLDLARHLQQELQEIGMTDVSLDENGYVMATLPANTSAKKPTIGFIAHMDTAPDAPGNDIHPRIVSNYDGKDIMLNADKNIVLSVATYPEIRNYKGQDIIVTDGTTLLGADDKAGIAEIMSAMEYLIQHPEIEHGKVRVAFTPDEEIGRGPAHFDVSAFGADWAYTMDGGAIGELEFENFNAASLAVTIHGINVHPGSAYHKMKNAMLIAHRFIAMLPADEIPAETQDYEGFFHLTSITGTVEEAKMQFIIRDHDKDHFNARKLQIQTIANTLNHLFGTGTVEYEIKDQYRNMREKIEPCVHIVDLATNAMAEAGCPAQVKPIRGGTDGAQLSFMGLPCPNIFAGGENFHSRFEYLPILSMEKAMQVIIKIIQLC
ncbi:MAG: peptidase T [Paludibacteraceae bacterium]|nr:peptidase T [Paludibacteraceae bacterium]